MKKYQAVRISVNGSPTYGDKYSEVYGNYNINDIVTMGNAKYIVIFECE